MKRRVAVVIRAADSARVEEAMRAALGLTLRGATVSVQVTPAQLATPLALRAAAALASFGHHVGPSAPSLSDTEVLEVWTDVGPGVTAEGAVDGAAEGAVDGAAEVRPEPEPEPDPARRVLHLLRPAAPHPRLGPSDYLVRLDDTGPVLATGHGAPFPPGPLTWPQLVTLLGLADLVVTW
ncbi:MAG: hypothetical protein IPI49_03790 [Myxococcales bacterium]|nr:hypothetical protein [Myxococcales bacterium]